MKAVRAASGSKQLGRTRRTALPIHRWLLVLCALCIAAVLVRAGWHYVDGATLLAVADIRISGCNHMTVERVREMTAIHKGCNIFSVDLAAVSRQLEREPWIYRAIVKRSLPNALDIQVVERRPLAVISQNGLYLIDDRAEIFKPAAEHERIYPLLTWSPGDQRSGATGEDVEIMTAALGLISALREASVPTGADTTIEMSRDFGLTLTVAQGSPSIYLGFGSHAEKLQHAAHILSDLAAKGLTANSIHLGALNKAYVRLLDGSEQGT